MRFKKRSFWARILRSVKIEQRPYNIAIVDDDQRVLESLGNLLESEGYSVCLFDSAEAFLQGDAVNVIDVLLSDVRMRVLDGLELQRRVGIKRPRLPVILITAHDDIDVGGTAQPNNRGVFRKPVGAAELLTAIESALK